MVPATPDRLGRGGTPSRSTATGRRGIKEEATGWEEERNEQERGGGGRGEERRGGRGGEIEHKQMQQLHTKTILAYFEGKAYFWRLQYYHNSEFNRYT